jgi:hypothetical protein
MTAITQEILHSFDRLPSEEQLEIAQQILRRLINFDFPSLTDDDLILSAEELFLDLDQQELDYE